MGLLQPLNLYLSRAFQIVFNCEARVDAGQGSAVSLTNRDLRNTTVSLKNLNIDGLNSFMINITDS